MKKNIAKNPQMWLGVVLLCGAIPTQAQTWTWPGCPSPGGDVTNANFSYTTLLKRGVAPDPNLAEPDKMDFDMDAAGNVDIYFTEIRPGNIKRYNAATNTVTTLATLPRWTGPYTSVANGGNIEEGVTGVVLDPNYKINHYLYVHWSPANAVVFRISRFTVSGNTMGSEKIILDIPAQRNECCHTGGAMSFDAYGDMWIAQGANGARGTNTNPTEGIDETLRWRSEEWGASNTHGLRGGILRIHPDNSTKGYTIPSGNFGEYFAAQTGNNQYLDTSKVSPEIYTKGSRNCYSLALDPVRRWVAWGDVGPDVMATNVREEDNLRKTPAFMGWPYFVGNNTVFSYSGTAKNPAAPTNTSVWNTGLTTLPPATGTIHLHTIGSSPLSGPIYRYDGDLVSNVKFPPHFTRKWFISDWSSSQVNVLTLDSLGNTVTGAQAIFGNFAFHGPMDFKSGPDGAMYVVNYGTCGVFCTDAQTSIVKIAYTGTCRPTDPKLEQPTGTYLNPGARYVQRPGRGVMYLVNLHSGNPITVPEDQIGFELFDMMGRKLWENKHLRPGQKFVLPATLPSGAMKARWISALP